MQQKEGVCKTLKGRQQLTTLASQDDDYELPLGLLLDFSVYTGILKGVRDSNMVANSPHIWVSLDNVRSGLSDSSKVSPRLSTLPSPRHLPGVEDLAASAPFTLAGEGEVHTAVTRVVPQGPPPVVLPFSWARSCMRMGTLAYHIQFPAYLLMADHPICHL